MTLWFEICFISESYCHQGSRMLWTHVLNEGIWGEGGKRGKTMITAWSIQLTSTWVLSLVWSWLLYQWFCTSRVLEAGFLMEHGGKLQLQLGSTVPLKSPKLHYFDSLAEYSISSPVLGPGDVLVQYLGLCDLTRWVCQWHFRAAAYQAIERCTLGFLYPSTALLLPLGVTFLSLCLWK